MADLLLPIVDQAASCRAALAAMKANGRSGVITHQRGRSRVYAASDIVIAFSENRAATLAEVKPKMEIVQREYEKASAYASASAGGDAGSPEDFESGSMMLLSVEEDLLVALQASPQDCYCRVDGKPVPGGNTNGDCPDGHPGSVRCV